MEHKKITTNHGEIHYWIKKANIPSAKCIVFTHGLAVDHSMFEKQMTHFYQVIRFLFCVGIRIEPGR